MRFMPIHKDGVLPPNLQSKSFWHAFDEVEAARLSANVDFEQLETYDVLR